MTELSHSARKHLSGVHPLLQSKVMSILSAMEALGHPMTVTNGLRTVEEQKALYAKGRTSPGSIVTNCDGELKRSNHQAKSDGLGHAVDCAFVVNGSVRWDDSDPWGLYGAMAETLGLKWGGRFTTLVDRPHIELHSDVAAHNGSRNR